MAAEGFHGEVSVVGARIRALRMARGWSQGQLAVRSGVDRKLISKLETGRIHSVELTVGIALARSLGVTPDDLMDGSRRA